jgi:hypothetical protein
MRIIICAVFLCELLLAAPLLRAQDVQIMMTGEFHKGEVKAESSETWFGLYDEGGQLRLVRTTIKVETVRDVCVDEKEEEKTGMLVSCDKPGTPLFLVRGIEGLDEREAKTAYQGHKFLCPGEILKLDQGRNAIRMIAFGDMQKPEPGRGPYYRNYSVQFWTGPRPDYHMLAEYPLLETFDAIPYLIWAGDLDNDGKIDMFWDLTDHYAGRHYTLFLSSLAKEGEWLKKVAEVIYRGC